jgi:signal transduction histidine kinase
MATIGEIAGMVGHDIRNPLQSIEGAVYLAKEELKSSSTESEEKKELSEILEIIEILGILDICLWNEWL